MALSTGLQWKIVKLLPIAHFLERREKPEVSYSRQHLKRRESWISAVAARWRALQSCDFSGLEWNS